ncbi:MAG: N-acetylmuramoyl-L-alanine amidase [Chloroflexota bacterium]
MAFRNIQIDIDDAVFLAALNRATTEGKAVGGLVVEFLTQYARGASATPPLASKATAASAAAGPTSYTVQRGDTLGRIAQKVYGDAHKYPLIQNANNIVDAARIWVGQVLTIPPLPGSTAPAAATPAPPLRAVTPAPVVPIVSPIAPPVEVTPSPARPGQAPPKPPIQWVGSPNFNARRNPTDITAVVIHSTANSNLQGVIDWFNNPSAQVSAHYTIGKDGKTVQHVKDSDRAWHAGTSVWKGRQSVNDYGLGIELVNLNDGQDPYPEAQHQANVNLCAYLCYRYNIKVDDIMGHVDIALPPGRKSDPRGYDLQRLRREVAAILGD